MKNLFCFPMTIYLWYTPNLKENDMRLHNTLHEYLILNSNQDHFLIAESGCSLHIFRQLLLWFLWPLSLLCIIFLWEVAHTNQKLKPKTSSNKQTLHEDQENKRKHWNSQKILDLSRIICFSVVAFTCVLDSLCFCFW